MMKYQGDINKTGGLAARKKSGPLWEFLPGDDGSFISPFADYISGLYFPLMNSRGMKCSVTPELKGDVAASFRHYLTAPTVTEELHRNVAGRNFWVKIDGRQAWSATGNSAVQKAAKWDANGDVSEVEGRIGAFISRRKNESLGIACEITVCVPETDDLVELMKVTVKNISEIPLSFIPFSATPLFGRHADNLRDHRQVTTMFQRVYTEKHGVRVKPTIVHDESGHSVNTVNYAILGFEADGASPEAVWSLMADFTGEGGSLDNPEAVAAILQPPVYAEGEADGKEAIGAMRYSEKKLMPGDEVAYVILHGITEQETDIGRWGKKYGSAAKFDFYLDETLAHWQRITSAVAVSTADNNFDNWTKWVSFQLKCRQIFGNSYLPDFGYGRGGRGWRDLWQDLLSIFLLDPEGAREEIINSMKGVRVDGSNATIIGTEPGSFIADRNNVPRSWCDHGAWPVFVISFYIDQTGDYDILFKDIPYWKDRFSHRSKKTDPTYDPAEGHWQKTPDGSVYHAGILEHLLIQQLTAFYNVGGHNILLLEGADWNDTYDMAREKGESPGFYAFYAQNLRTIAQWLKVLAGRGVAYIHLLREVNAMLNTNGHTGPYNRTQKQKRLQEYFDTVTGRVSGEKICVGVQTLILDLLLKADHITEVLQEQEWIQLDNDKGFYNGHYDNLGKAVDGRRGDRVMMDLTTQVMAILHDLAGKDRIRAMMKAADRYLKDGKGYRLCTPFPAVDMNVGRITGFVYGNKEHGSKWMQQNVMLANGLYRHGFGKMAHDIMEDAYRLSTDSASSRIFPGLPSYFGPGDKGAYAYLTGSSAWYLLTLTTRVFGVRGEEGSLCLQPALQPTQFDENGTATIRCTFRGFRLAVTYHLVMGHKTYFYTLDGIQINGKQPQTLVADGNRYVIAVEELQRLCHKKENKIEVELIPVPRDG
jgi:cellobiose phosphorylase